MAECEIYHLGEAYSQHFPEGIRRDLSERSGGYEIKDSEVLCPVGGIIGKCPYGKEAKNKEGIVIKMFDGTETQKSICSSEGLVEKIGKIDLKKIEKPKEKRRDSRRPF